MTQNTPVEAPSEPLVLSTQLLFNIGFYAIVPFLATHMRDNLLLSGGAVGFVLGVRTFSQQGMFFVGGLLAERFGCRALILTGCIVRICGYLCLAGASSIWGMTLGACLTGLGGAMFSPCLESMAAQIDIHRKSHARRHNIFAKMAVCGELGAVAGPLLGSLLFGIGFFYMALASAAIFLLALLVLGVLLPSTPVKGRESHEKATWITALGDSQFVQFMLLYSTYLFSYNQMYFGLPIELERSNGSAVDMAFLFALASIIVVVFQMPIALIAKRMSSRRVLVLGFALLSAAFVSSGLWATVTPMTGILRLLPAIMMVILLMTGQMFVVPVAMSLVPRFANNRSVVIYYGCLASTGGIMVLLGNLLIGDLLDTASMTSIDAMLAWLSVAAFPALSAIAFANNKTMIPEAR